MAIDKKYIYSELTGKIISLAIKVHKALGPGFPERFYHKALIHELACNKIGYDTEKSILIQYEGLDLGIQRIDLIVGDKIILEIKVVSSISEVNIAQLVSYLKASGKKVGLILNFAKNKIDIKRVII